MGRTAALIYNGMFNLVETVDATISPGSGTNGATRRFDAYNLATNLSSTGTPALHGDAIDISRTLDGANGDIDLTAAPLARDITKTVDLTGKKLVSMCLSTNAANNVAGVLVKPHAVNGYALFGPSGQKTLYPNAHHQETIASGGTPQLPAVAADKKVISLSGNNGDVISGFLVFAS